VTLATDPRPGQRLNNHEQMPNHVYKILELTGSSPAGIEAAVSTAIAKADETVRNMQWFEVVETRGHIQDGKVAHWQ
jgi:flavin-binding protein dodecin